MKKRVIKKKISSTLKKEFAVFLFALALISLTYFSYVYFSSKPVLLSGLGDLPRSCSSESQTILTFPVGTSYISYWNQAGWKLCYDYLFGTAYTDSVVFAEDPNEATNFNITLTRGWNFISSKTQDNLTQFKSSFSTWCPGTSITQLIYRSNTTNISVDNIEPGKAYMMDISANCNFSYRFNRYLGTTINLSIGYNDVGIGKSSYLNDITFNRENNCKILSIQELVYSSERMVFKKITLPYLSSGKGYRIRCGTGNDIPELNFNLDTHRCNGTNYIVSLNDYTGSNASFVENKFNALCYGNLQCFDVALERECKELNGKILFWMNKSFNSPISYSPSVSYPIGICCKSYRSNCQPSWSCSDWGECSENIQTRTCEDVNLCDLIPDDDLLRKNCVEPCVSNWSCTNWTNCSNGIQNRTCVDLNKCIHPTDIQELERECELPPCTSNWSCTNWTNCSTGIQKRNCTDLNSCPGEILTPPIPDLNQSCAIEGCVQNWTILNTSCLDNDYIISYYNDSNSCNNLTGKPANFTNTCDFDNNKLIGNSTSISGNFNFNISINNSPISSSPYTGLLKVDILDGNITRVSFYYNFTSSTLNLRDLRIEKQPTNNIFGYLIIDGLKLKKSVYVDRLNLSGYVCIKEATIGSISGISDRCDSTSETLLACPGDNDIYFCNITNNKFYITGLNNSAVKEFNPTPGTILPPGNGGGNTPISGCVQNWNCSNWGACVSNLHNRTCVDRRNCNNITGRPALQEACSSLPHSGCTENWNCSYSPSTCPKEKLQTASCVDLNDCGTELRKPSSTRACEYKSPFNITLIISIIIGVLILIIVIIIIIILLKRRNQSTDQATPRFQNTPLVPPTPPSTPIMPTPSPPQQPGLGYPYSRNPGWQQPR